jgi:cell division protein FtsQ
MDILNNDSLRSRFLSDDIHRIATFLRSEPFWEALVDQLVVRSDGLFELIPKVGGQRILIGDGTALEQRFAKLRLFYAKGMPMTDWRRYELIDLRFADQVVCTQRTTP